MGIEAIALILSLAAGAALLMLMGRLFWILIKIALIGFVLWFLLAKLPALKTEEPVKLRPRVTRSL